MDIRAWKLYPCIGEIHKGNVLIIFEPKDKLFPLVCMVSIREEIVLHEKVNPNLVGPSSVSIGFPIYPDLYKIVWSQNDKEIAVQNILVADEPNQIIVAGPDKQYKNNLWKRVLQDLQDPYLCTYMIHLGPNIDGKSVFEQISSPQTSAKGQHYADEQYREQYRSCMSAYHELSSCVSHYWLWNYNDLGTHLELFDQGLKPIQKFAIECSIRVHHEFQDMFHLRPVDTKTHTWVKSVGARNDTLLVGVELGLYAPAHDDVIALIQDYGSAIKRVIICFGSAPVPNPNVPPLNKGSRRMNNNHNYWNENETSIFYNALFDWMGMGVGVENVVGEEGVLSDREVLVIGTGLGLGMISHMVRGSSYINIMLTGPMAVKTSPDIKAINKAFTGLKMLIDSVEQGHMMMFVVDLVVNGRCYGLINLDMQPMEMKLTSN